MSCWVVPSIAADLWGMPLEQVMGRIQSGAVPSKSEHGWLLVDVAPQSTTFRPPIRKPRRRRPQTFTAISALTGAEVEALSIPPLQREAAIGEPTNGSFPWSDPAPSPSDHISLPTPAGDEESPESEPDLEPDDGKPMDWRGVRQRVGRTRRRRREAN